jgi:hypothetical protein
MSWKPNFFIYLDGTSAFVMINRYPESPSGGAHYGRNNKE